MRRYPLVKCPWYAHWGGGGGVGRDGRAHLEFTGTLILDGSYTITAHETLQDSGFLCLLFFLLSSVVKSSTKYVRTYVRIVR